MSPLAVQALLANRTPSRTKEVIATELSVGNTSRNS
jgi:hypothetical protein